MRKFLLASSIAGLAFAACPALTADLPVAAAPMAPAVFNWSGCYVGANGGWMDSKTNYTLTPAGSYILSPGTPSPPNAAGSGLNPQDFAALTHGYQSSGSGGLIGAQVGCNFQGGPFVVGIEADWQWSGAKNSGFGSYASFRDLGNPAFTIPSSTESVSSKLNSFTTIRGRAGYAWDRLYGYITSGVVVADVQSDTLVAYSTFPVLPVLNGAVHSGSSTAMRTGFVIGAGLEYAFWSNFSLKVEYLFYTPFTS